MCSVCLNKNYSNCPVCTVEEEPLRADAQTYLEVYVYCPYCGNQVENASNKLIQHLDSDLRGSNIEVEITCDSHKCGKIFIVENINY